MGGCDGVTAPDLTVIRATGPDDADAVSALLRVCYTTLMAPGYPPGALSQALPFMMRANPTLLRSGRYYVAETADGALIGCGGWSLERPDAPQDPVNPALGHIRHFATHPDWIRRGVGKALIDRCVDDARARGVQRFECWASLVAQRFYESAGFRLLAPLDVRIGASVVIPSLRMMRDPL